MVLLLAILGCTRTPLRIEDESEVDKHLSQQNYAAACVGLENLDAPSLRTYTAQQLVPHELVSDARNCLCDALYDPDAHRADLAVAKGVVQSKRDDLARCLAPAVSDPEVPERAEVIKALARIGSKAGYEALEVVLKSDTDPVMRAEAARALRYSSKARQTLIVALRVDADPTVRAAAAEGLAGRREREVATAVAEALDGDDDARVRAAALGAMVASEAPGATKRVCRTLMDDQDGTMRLGAAKALHGTKRSGGIDCLKRRLTEGEDNPAVRTAIMESLAASPSDKAADALCALVHPVLKKYVKDKIAEETPGVDIMKYQNNRDHERSYECAMAAKRRGGLSCYANNHIGKWINDLGGKAHRPLCPGMDGAE